MWLCGPRHHKKRLNYRCWNCTLFDIQAVFILLCGPLTHFFTYCDLQALFFLDMSLRPHDILWGLVKDQPLPGHIFRRSFFHIPHIFVEICDRSERPLRKGCNPFHRYLIVIAANPPDARQVGWKKPKASKGVVHKWRHDLRGEGVNYFVTAVIRSL